jgi:integrase
MANLIKPWLIRYVDDRTRRRVPASTPGASKVRERASKWYGQGVPGWPPKKRVPLATRKATAQAMLNRLVEEAIRGRAGLTDRYREHAARPLGEHLVAYRRALEAKGDSPFHVAQTVARAAAVAEGCGFRFTAEIDADRINEWLAERRRPVQAPALPADRDTFSPKEVAALLGVSNTALWQQARRLGVRAEGRGKARRYGREGVEALLARAGRGNSVQTANFYLAAFKSFCRWLVRDRRMGESPVAHLQGGNPKLDRRHDRRELAVEELVRVMEAARVSAAAFRGLTGEDRFHVYLAAIGTGFRAGELATLRPGSFALDAAPPTATLPFAATKNRKGATQPLPPSVTAALRGYLAGKPAGGPVWPGRWHKNAADMLRIDLEAAGVPYSVEGPDGPLYADFHALRHSYISHLSRAGVSPKEAQALARHGDIRLTLQRYTHVGLADLAAAVGKVPMLAAADGSAVAPPDRASVVETVSLPPADLEALRALAAVGLMLAGALLGCTLVAPRVAPTADTPGDGSGRAGTEPPADWRAA